jgi:hypothetical protein
MSDERSQSDAARDVLREIWEARDETSTEPTRPPKVCKNMVNVGFDAMAGPDGDLRAAWRAKLASEGKLDTSGESIRDLVLGAQSRDATR